MNQLLEPRTSCHQSKRSVTIAPWPTFRHLVNWCHFISFNNGPITLSRQPEYEVFSAIINKEPALLRSINHYIRPALEAINVTALTKIKRRYRTAKEVADDLDRFIGSSRIHASKPGLLHAFRGIYRRYKIVTFSIHMPFQHYSISHYSIFRMVTKTGILEYCR